MQLLSEAFPEPSNVTSPPQFILFPDTSFSPWLYIFLLLYPVHRLPSLTEMQGLWALRVYLHAQLLELCQLHSDVH